jgi:hypothetical protein
MIIVGCDYHPSFQQIGDASSVMYWKNVLSGCVSSSFRPGLLKIVQKYDVAAPGATRDQQPSAVGCPIEIENPARGKVGQLSGLSISQGLLPDVGRPIASNEVLQAIPVRRPAGSLNSPGASNIIVEPPVNETMANFHPGVAVPLYCSYK